MPLFLMRHFCQYLPPAIQELQPNVCTDTIKRVHTIILLKIYNATSGEFLRTITKLSCKKQKKGVDVNI